uniref:Trimethylguanosine synthase n=1 Tax=Globisporangium ultimum (strain ATCC 200006 / CBS 805.95 / DAOM BR144) TaxID=431595 RepID=K3X203_GLOUD
MVESVVRLLSRNGETLPDTSNGKKSKHVKKRRRVDHPSKSLLSNDDEDASATYEEAGSDAATDPYYPAVVENGDDVEDPQASLFQEAQSQLLEEMTAAGLAGSLPLSFGNSKRQPAAVPRKRRRERMDDELRRFHAAKEQASQPMMMSGQKEKEEEPKQLEKVHVKYDSDGEVAERVVETIEVTVPKDADNGPSEQQDDEDVATSSTGIVHQEIPPETSPIFKFWKQRKHLFYRYDDGILLDHESWYSVTPQAIAEHIARRLQCDIVVDPFAGCGGNVIQLAMVCKHVIAIDIDPEKIRMAKHNAAIYGVAHKIEWIVGNSLEILPTVKADVVFLSPPWGGLHYSRDHFRLDEMLVKGVSGVELFAKARQVSPNIAYYLPKTTPDRELEALAPDELVECEKMYLNKQLKVVTAYYGDLARLSKAQARKASPREVEPDTEDSVDSFDVTDAVVRAESACSSSADAADTGNATSLLTTAEDKFGSDHGELADMA